MKPGRPVAALDARAEVLELPRRRRAAADGARGRPSGSRPACAASVSPSATAASVVTPITWFTSLVIWPWPGRAHVRDGAADAPRTPGRARANASGVAADHDRERPGDGPLLAARHRRVEEAHPGGRAARGERARRVGRDRARVDHQRGRAPRPRGRRPARPPPSSTSGPSGRQVTHRVDGRPRPRRATSRPRAPARDQRLDARSPSGRARRPRGPRRRRLRAMGAPMMPRPMTPTRMRRRTRTGWTGRGRLARMSWHSPRSACDLLAGREARTLAVHAHRVAVVACPSRDDLRRVRRVRAANIRRDFPGRVGIGPRGHLRGPSGARGVRARSASTRRHGRRRASQHQLDRHRGVPGSHGGGRRG